MKFEKSPKLQISLSGPKEMAEAEAVLSPLGPLGMHAIAALRDVLQAAENLSVECTMVELQLEDEGSDEKPQFSLRLNGTKHTSDAASKELKAKLATSIDDMDFSVRTYKRLEAQGVRTVADLIDKTEAQLLKIRGFGTTSLEEVKTKLSYMDLELKRDEKAPPTKLL